jgi:MSHA biogenesis protein MshM
VSGEIGSGKTMLCRVLIERLPPEVQTVFLANPSYSRAEILQAIAEELSVRPAAGQSALAIRDLQAHLIEQYAAGRRVVILIDEAHAMPQDALEQVRLLSNLESSRHKLLQIVLFGQPELDEALDAPSMRQLKDRITHSFRMRPLAGDEIAKYISFRMRAAGYRGPEAFDTASTAAIARASNGLTRRVNVLADKALLAAFAAGANSVTTAHARAAIADSEFAPLKPASTRARYFAIGAALLAGGAVAGAALFALLQEKPAPAPAAPVSAPKPQPAAEPAKPAAAPEPKPEAKTESETPKPPPGPLLDAVQVKRLLSYPTGGSRLLTERIAAAREMLDRAPDDHYSLELFIAENSDPARMERFLLRARDLVPLEELFLVPVAIERRYQIRVLYGAFPDRDSAVAAAQKLPPKYQRAFEIQPRSLSAVRGSL